MLSYKERRAKFFNQRKRLAIHQWLSTAAITVVAVVAASVLIPKEATAHFLQLESFGSDIYYEVEIVDEEETITPGTLKIVAQNQLEYYEKSLDLGYHTGSFLTLHPDTTYQVSIRAHRGFGEEILDQKKIATTNNYGAAVTEVRFNEVNMEGLAAEFDITYNDLKQELKDITFLIAYFEEETDPLYYEYSQYPITSFQETVPIADIPNYNLDLHLIIQATLIETNEVIQLFEKTMDTPISLYVSIYADKAGTDYIDISAYLDFQTTNTVTYEIQLLLDGRVIRQIYPTADQVETLQHESAVFQYRFTKLRENTKYHLKVIATYLEQQITKTKEEMVDCYTTLPYDVQITVTQNVPNMLVEIQVSDSHLLLSDFYYSYYEIVDGSYQYIGGNYIQLSTTDQINYTGTLELPIKTTHQYEITINAKITVNIEFTYYWAVFYEEIWDIK